MTLSDEDKIKVLKWRLDNWKQNPDVWSGTPPEMGISPEEEYDFLIEMASRYHPNGGSADIIHDSMMELERLEEKVAAHTPPAAPVLTQNFHVNGNFAGVAGGGTMTGNVIFQNSPVYFAGAADLAKAIISADTSLPIEIRTGTGKELDIVRDGLLNGKIKPEEAKSRLSKLANGLKKYQSTIMFLADLALKFYKPG